MLLITFHNDGTGDTEIAHYDVVAQINYKIIWSGRIEYHVRGDFKDLVIELAEQFKLEQYKENNK